MKLVSYQSASGPRFGAVSGGHVVDVAAASAEMSKKDRSITPLPHRIEGFFDNIDVFDPSLRKLMAIPGIEKAEASMLLADAKLLAPIQRPPKIVCIARNYAEHAKEAGLEISPIPIIFPRFSATLIADGAPVVVPKVSHQLDWEGELALIIGKHTNGRRLSKAEAMPYVYGYTIFNDVTVRDYQFRVTQYTAGKNFRHSGPFGPMIITADEIADPHNLQITTTLNGEVMQSASTSTMIYDIPTIIEHISDFIDLEPGDVIPTGTPAGVGFKRKPPVFLKEGDRIAVEIEGIGRLENPVVNES
jgi:2-keto-4-pentenoate hydratase/2-oxohepta-3-ene-1,7-dioic acid hydratase in catechol pathway